MLFKYLLLFMKRIFTVHAIFTLHTRTVIIRELLDTSLSFQHKMTRNNKVLLDFFRFSRTKAVSKSKTSEK